MLLRLIRTSVAGTHTPSLALIVPGGILLMFLQQSANIGWIALYTAIITALTTLLVKGIDTLNDRRKEKKAAKDKKTAEDEADEALQVAEKSQLRLEERSYYQSVIERAIESQRIAGARGHAYANEVDRLRNQTLKLLELWPRDRERPLGIIIFNEDLNRVLAELEGLPLPPIAMRPGSLGDPHKTSSPDIPASLFRPPKT